MKAIRFDRFGPPEVLTVVDLPKPVPNEGEVLVRVHAAGVNFFEVLMRANRYAVTPELPMIPGVEVAGVVEATGGEVDADMTGKRVAVPLFALGRGGGYAEYVVADAAAIVPLPDALSFADAVALMVQGLTALHMVRRSGPVDATVLIHAAAGGVGSLLVQLIKRAGAKRIITTASTIEKRSLSLSLGADVAIDYSADGWEATAAAERPSVIYDTIGGEVTHASLAALADGGKLMFAALGRFTLGSEQLNTMLERNQSLKGFALLPLLGASLADDLSMLFRLAIANELKLTPALQFPIEHAGAAHRAIESRRTRGKVVLRPQSDCDPAVHGNRLD